MHKHIQKFSPVITMQHGFMKPYIFKHVICGDVFGKTAIVFEGNWMGLVINHRHPQLKLKLSIFATISD